MMRIHHRAGNRHLPIFIFALLAFSVYSSDSTSSGIRLYPIIDAVNISLPCSMAYSSASLEFFSDPSSSVSQHSGSSSLSADHCCTGADPFCEWIVSPLLSGTIYRMKLVIFRETASDGENAHSDPPSIYHFTAHTLSPFAALPPSLSFSCESIDVSWLAASPPISSPLQSQQLVAIRSGSGTGQDTTVLLDLPAAQGVAKLLLPLPSMLVGVSVQFVVISYFGATRDGIVTNTSSLPSISVNFSHGYSQVSDIATAAGMQAFADSSSVTVLFKKTPAFAFVALYSSSDFPFIGCNRSSSSIKISSTGHSGCLGCGFQKASRTLTFERLPSSTDWTVALCVPIVSPPSPCSDAPGALSSANTIFVRTSNVSLLGEPEVTDINIVIRGVRVCWRYLFSATSNWSVTMRFNATSSVAFIKEPADLIVQGCTVDRSCSICSDFALDIDSFCAMKNNSNAVITVMLLPAFSTEPLHRSSSGYPIFSLCNPPPPKISVCLVADSAHSNEGFVNISWPLQPISISRLLLTIYSVDALRTSIIHNISVDVSQNFISLPLPLGFSSCLVGRSSSLLNIFSELTTPICGLQVNIFLDHRNRDTVACTH